MTIYWYILAPDFRFASGAFFGITFLLISILISQKEKLYPKLGEKIIILFALVLLLSSFKRIYNFYLLLHPTSIEAGGTALHSVFYMPYSSKNQAKARHIPQQYSEYRMGDLILYITADTKQGICYDRLPATSDVVLTGHTRGPEISTVAARGNTLQECFRPKKHH